MMHSTGDDLMDMAAECGRQNVKIERLTRERDMARAEVERLRAGLNLALDTARALADERDEARALADQMHDSVAHFMHERDEARALARWYGQRLNEQGGMPRKEFNDAKFRYPWLEFPGWLEERR